MSQNKDIIEQMRKTVAEYDKKEKERKQKQLEKTPVTLADMKQILMSQMEKKPGDNNSLICSNCRSSYNPEDMFCPNCGTKINRDTAAAQPKQNISEERKQIAFQLWKDSRSTSIVCMICMVFPLICSVIAMVSFAAAILVAFIGLIYPCMVFVKSMTIQARCYRKYGLKPLFMFNQGSFLQGRRNMQQNNFRKEGGFL